LGGKELGTIIVDGRGTERRVLPRTRLPKTPERQVIAFPDKKEVKVDWRRNFDHITEISKAIEELEIVQEEGTFNVPMTNPDIPFAMGLVFSDAHIGSTTSDHELVRSLLDTVLTTPNSFLVDTGDTFDNGIWGGLQFEQAIPPYMQQFTVADMMREMGDKYGACVIGNHPQWMFNVTGQRPEDVFAKQMKGPIFAGIGLLHLKVGEQNYDWALAHTYWGKSKKNIFNCCVNLRNHEYPDADVFTIGHEHIWGHMKEMVDGKERLYLRPGTAKLKDRYARIHGIARRGQECGLAVIFSANEKRFEAYPIKDAVELMLLREEIATYSK